MTTDLVLQVLLMAVWRRKPKGTVTIHSDQGSQFTGHTWQAFLRQHGLEPSMSHHGNCHDAAVAESALPLTAPATWATLRPSPKGGQTGQNPS